MGRHYDRPPYGNEMPGHRGRGPVPEGYPEPQQDTGFTSRSLPTGPQRGVAENRRGGRSGSATISDYPTGVREAPATPSFEAGSAGTSG